MDHLGQDDAHRSSTAHVELQGISKQFGGVQALGGISLQIPSSSVHALVGENGAGKSTLGKIVAGAIQPDAGRMLVNGTPVSFRSPREALGHGIASIAQELLVVPGLTVAQNVFLGAEPNSAGWVRRGTLKQRYQQLARDAGFSLPADQPVGGLRVAERQQVEIMRALARDAQLIIMDEPSAALSGPDIERLHEIIRSLAAGGTTVLLVSHFLREVLDLADSVTVLRDGHLIRTAPAAQETEESLIQGMLGRPLGAAYPSKVRATPDAPVVFSAHDIVAAGVSGVSLQVRAGEILALAGLVGAGRSELAHAIFGSSRRRAGEVRVDGDLLDGHPVVSLRRGLVMIPESRRDQGLVMGRSVIENASLASITDHSRAGFVSRRAERGAVGQALSRVGLVGNRDAPVVSLSGGNQQKALFARALLCKPRVLIADEPTRGVDVGAKRAIYDLIVGLATEGTAVLLISSELEEVLGLAHRVLVMRRGLVVKELTEDQMSESAILGAAFGDGGVIKRAA